MSGKGSSTTTSTATISTGLTGTDVSAAAPSVQPAALRPALSPNEESFLGKGPFMAVVNKVLDRVGEAPQTQDGRNTIGNFSLYTVGMCKELGGVSMNRLPVRFASTVPGNNNN